MNINKVKNYLRGVAQDEFPTAGGLGNGGGGGRKVGKYGLSHPDGTPCDAKRPENCPEYRRQQALLSNKYESKLPKLDVSPDRLECPKDDSDDLSQTKPSAGNKKGASVLQACDDMTDDEFEELDNFLDDTVNQFKGKSVEIYGSGSGLITANYNVKGILGPSKMGRDEDGKWTVQRKPYFSNADEALGEDRKAFDEHMSEYGLGADRDFRFDEDDVFDMEMTDVDDITAQGSFDARLEVTDTDKFQQFKDSFKKGGSRRPSYLDEEEE